MDEVKFETLKEKIRQLYKLTSELKAIFPDRSFTPDGHLVGSIGEVLVSSYYGLRLLPASTETHDAESKNGKMVQIKATQGKSVSLYSEPNYIIVIKLHEDGEFSEKYNGPGKIVWDASGKIQKNGQRSILLSKLERLMLTVAPEEKFERVK